MEGLRKKAHEESLLTMDKLLKRIGEHQEVMNDFWRENELRSKMLLILRDNIFCTRSVEEWKRKEMKRVLLVWAERAFAPSFED